MIALCLLPAAAFVWIVVDFFRNWEEWLGHEPAPSIHIAGEDDQDLDFTAALRSIGRVPR